jgi:hypothetical protein
MTTPLRVRVLSYLKYRPGEFFTAQELGVQFKKPTHVMQTELSALVLAGAIAKAGTFFGMEK